MKVYLSSKNHATLQTFIFQLQFILKLSQIQAILSTYSDLFLLFAKYRFLFENDFLQILFLKSIPSNLENTAFPPNRKNSLVKVSTTPVNPHEFTGPQGPISPTKTQKIPDASSLLNNIPTNKYSSEKGKRNKHNKSDKSNIEFPPGTKVTVETSGLDFNILTIFNLLSKGGLITIQGGFFDAKFTVDTGDGHVYNFTARYRYSVKQKDGCEISLLGASILAGKATKVFDNVVDVQKIANDFTQAGTDSFGVGFSLGLGGSASGSYSGNWESGQFSLGGGISVKGFPSLPAGGIWSHTATRLNENSIVEYGYDMWRPYEY